MSCVHPWSYKRILWESRKEWTVAISNVVCTAYTYIHIYLFHHKLCYQSLQILDPEWILPTVVTITTPITVISNVIMNEAQLSNLCCAQPAILIFRFYHRMIHTTANNRYPVIALKWAAIILYSGRDRWRWSFLLASSFFSSKNSLPWIVRFSYIARIFHQKDGQNKYAIVDWVAAKNFLDNPQANF